MVTLGPDTVKDFTEVNATGTDQYDKTANAEPVSSGFDDTTPEAADAPTLVANNDGSVTATPGANNVEQQIKFTDEDDQPVTVTATRGEDGQWTLNPEAPEDVNIDADTGVVTLGPDTVKDFTEVNATGTDQYDKTANAEPVSSGFDDTTPEAADAPTLVANNDGSVTATPGADNVEQQIKFTDEDDQPVTVTATRGEDGQWTLNPEAPEDVNIDADTGVVTLGPDTVKDFTEVNATGTDQYDKTANAEPVSSGFDDTTPEAADAPTLVANNDGSVTATPGADNVEQQIKFTDEDDQPVTVTATRGEDGQWTLNPEAPEDVNIDADTGVVTLGPDTVKDFTEVNATGTDQYDKTANAEPVSSGFDDTTPEAADAPTLVANNDGSVTATPGADNVEQQIQFTDEDDQPVTVTATRGEDGQWTLNPEAPEDVNIDADTGVVTLGPDTVKDFTEVNATEYRSV